MLDSTLTETKNLQRNLNRLNETIENPEYQNELSKAQNIIARAAQDSIYKRSNQSRILQAERFASKDSLIQIEQAKYEKSIELASKQIQTLKLLKDMYQQNGISAELDPKSRIVPFANGGIGRFFGTPKRLEIMDFSPNWSPLVLSGISLRGGLIEFNQNNLIFGICGGLTNSQSWDQNTFNKNNKVFAIRGGWGNLKGNNLMIQYLNYQPSIKNNEIKQYPTQVIGLIGNVMLTPNHKLNAETAWSSISNTEDVNEVTQIIQTIPNKLGNSSFSTAYSGKFTKLKLSVDARLRMDGKYFYSFGSPSNRQDCYRYSLSAKKGLIKNKVTLSAGFKQDGDHISGPKEHSVVVSTLQFGAGVTLKRATIRADCQQTLTKVKSNGQALSKVKLYNGSVSFPYNLLGMFSTGTAYGNYMQIAILGDSLHSTNTLLGYNQTTRLKGGISIQLSLTRNISMGSDSLSGWKTEIGANKAFKQFQLGITYGYQRFNPIEIRNNLSLEMGLSIGKRIQMQGTATYYNCQGQLYQTNNFLGGQIRVIITI
jgi:DNA-binding XRE family transcriptional regulator